MARMSNKEFSIRHQLIQLRRDRNRLDRIKERTDSDLAETRIAIKSLKSSLVEIEMEKREAAKPKKKSKKKAPVKKKVSEIIAAIEKNKKTFEPEESEVKVDASSMTAVEDSVELKDKKPVEKKTTTKAKEDTKTDPF